MEDEIEDEISVVEIIEKKLKDRLVFIKEYDKSFDTKTTKYKIKEPKEIDILGNQVRKLIKNNVDILPVDFSVESLTKLGDAPCIMYDDNGMFAVTGNGFQKVVFGTERLEGGLTVIVEKKMWKNTILKALKYYLK